MALAMCSLVNISDAGAAVSITPIAHLEMGRLVEAWHVAQYPVGDPIDHRLKRNNRRAEQLLCMVGIRQPRRGSFRPDDFRNASQSSAEFVGQPADGHFLRAADIDG